MSIRRIDLIISAARKVSGETRYSDTEGIGDAQFLEWANDAIDELQVATCMEDARVHTAYEEITVVSGQESYALPRRALAGNLIYKVEYSYSGNAADYVELDLGRDRYPNTGEPEEYVRDAGYLYLQPVPTTGKIRVHYEQRLDNLDIRRGKISAVSGTAPAITSIQLYDDDWLDSDALSECEVVCISTWDGTVTFRNISIDDYDSTTRTLTMRSGFSGVTGETAAADDFVTCGWNTSTHPVGPDMIDRYITKYLKCEAEKLRSNTDAATTQKDVDRLLARLVELYALLPGGGTRIPEIRGGY